MTTIGDWDSWEKDWRGATLPAAQLDAMIAATQRTRRSIAVVRVASLLLAVVALGVVGAALQHAANAFEAALGLVVDIGIAWVWWMHRSAHRGAVAGIDAVYEEYLEAARALCQRRVRFAELGSIVAALDLLFLAPWWIGGFRVHGVALSVDQVLTLWGPLAAILAFVAWTFRVKRNAQSTLTRLSRETELPPVA